MGDRIGLGLERIHNPRASNTKYIDVKYVSDQIEIRPRGYTTINSQTQSRKRLSMGP